MQFGRLTMPRWTFINQNKERQDSCCDGNHQHVEESFHCWFHHIAPWLSWADPACVPHPNTHPPLNGINRHFSEKRRQTGRRLVCINIPSFSALHHTHANTWTSTHAHTHTHTHTHTQTHTHTLVSEPDPRKIEKEGLAHWPGWKCTLRPV